MFVCSSSCAETTLKEDETREHAARKNILKEEHIEESLILEEKL